MDPLGKLFQDWLQARPEMIFSDVRPVFLEQHQKRGPGIMLFEFSSLEALRQGEAATKISFKELPAAEGLPVLEILEESQGDLPVMGMVMLPDGGANITTSVISYEVDTYDVPDAFVPEGTFVVHR